MIEEIKQETQQKMSQAIAHAQSELLKVRTGRANPDLLNSVLVDYYGSPTPLNQVSTISVPEPRLITLTPYEKTLIPIIEKAIMGDPGGFFFGEAIKGLASPEIDYDTATKNILMFL